MMEVETASETNLIFRRPSDHASFRSCPQRDVANFVVITLFVLAALSVSGGLLGHGAQIVFG